MDAAVAACGVGERRRGGKLPAHVVAYLTMGLCLFRDEDYGEVATNVTGALTRWGCWDASWSVPTAGGISQARKRLGRHVLAEVFERVAGPVADRSTRGAWLRGWRLLGIDGFEVDVADTPGNAEEFGYAGSGDNRSAFGEGAGGGAGRVRHPRVRGRRGRVLLERGEDPGQPALPAAATRRAAHRRSQLVRHEALHHIPGFSREELEDHSWIPWLTRTRKRFRGPEHANKTGGRVQADGAARRGEPRDMAKAGLLEL